MKTIDHTLRHNFIVNILDGGFFGFALGFASFITVIPLFVSTMADSATLIGLIPAIHNVGWQLPQLLTANRVAQLKRVKPMVLWLTIHERLPFVGLAGAAWLVPLAGPRLALVMTFLLLVWQGLGGGFTATAWQSMIAKIIPGEQRGTFLGVQASAANLLAGLSAIAAGFILGKLASPLDFALCFLLASASMAVSWGFLSLTREGEGAPASGTASRRQFWRQLLSILRRDGNFRWFLVARILTQFAAMAFAFYVVYAVRYYGMSEITAGLMTSVLMGTQIVANPVLGWLGDRFSHRAVMIAGALFISTSALLAWLAPSVGWFYLVFALTGIAGVTIWTNAMAITMKFGSEAERPAYIGLSNTLIAPATILAPLLGGWLADAISFQATFLASVIGGLVTALALALKLREPRV